MRLLHLFVLAGAAAAASAQVYPAGQGVSAQERLQQTLQRYDSAVKLKQQLQQQQQSGSPDTLFGSYFPYLSSPATPHTLYQDSSDSSDFGHFENVDDLIDDSDSDDSDDDDLTLEMEAYLLRRSTAELVFDGAFLRPDADELRDVQARFQIYAESLLRAVALGSVPLETVAEIVDALDGDAEVCERFSPMRLRRTSLPTLSIRGASGDANARCALLAGARLGNDLLMREEPARTRWRRQGIEALLADRSCALYPSSPRTAARWFAPDGSRNEYVRQLFHDMQNFSEFNLRDAEDLREALGLPLIEDEFIR